MLIDWFTAGAQLFNFLLLVWLLKRFLYRPVLSAIDERERLIAGQLQDAEHRKEEARTEREDLRRKSARLDEERGTLLTAAVHAAGSERERLLDSARKEADVLRSRLQETIRNERETLSREIVSRSSREVFAIARKALTDLAGASLEERVTEVFLRRLRGMDEGQRASLAKSLDTSSGPVCVRTAFALPPAQRTAIEAAFHEVVSTEGRLQFDTAPDVISGIELTSDGYKLAWSIADYLTSLSNDVASLLESRAGPAPAKKKDA